MPDSRLSLEDYKLVAEVRAYVTTHRKRVAIAAAWLDLQYTFDAIAERKYQQDLRIAQPLGEHALEGVTKMRLENPLHETFARLVDFCTDAIKWDLSLFTDEGRDLHAHAILYVNWLITDPQAALRGLDLTEMERTTFSPRTSEAAAATTAKETEAKDTWYMDRDWVRMTVFDEQLLRGRWLDQVAIALFEVGLPRPKQRRISTADLQAAHSYLWAVTQDKALAGTPKKRFTKAQHQYVVKNNCPAYAGSKPPAFASWRTQVSRGLPAVLQIGASAPTEVASQAEEPVGDK